MGNVTGTCRNGHERTEANTTFRNGIRTCLDCQREKGRKTMKRTQRPVRSHRPRGRQKRASEDVPKKTVEAVKQRDKERCARCGRVGANVHHRRMRSQSPKAVVHNIENLVLFCGSGTQGCHGYVHGHPSESYEKGWLVRSFNDPVVIPLWEERRGRWVELAADGTKREVQNENLYGA